VVPVHFYLFWQDLFFLTLECW